MPKNKNPLFWLAMAVTKRKARATANGWTSYTTTEALKDVCGGEELYEARKRILNKAWINRFALVTPWEHICSYRKWRKN